MTATERRERMVVVGGSLAGTIIVDTLRQSPSPYFWTEQFGISVKACGQLPAVGEPTVLEGEPESGGLILKWSDNPGGATAAAVNRRIPISRLRALVRPDTQLMEVKQ